MSEADRQAGEQQALDAVLMTEGERQHLQGGFPVSAFADGAEWGAGWAFAIVGMAQAIADRYPAVWPEGVVTGETPMYDPEEPVSTDDAAIVRHSP